MLLMEGKKNIQVFICCVLHSSLYCANMRKQVTFLLVFVQLILLGVIDICTANFFELLAATLSIQC